MLEDSCVIEVVHTNKLVFNLRVNKEMVGEEIHLIIIFEKNGRSGRSALRENITIGEHDEEHVLATIIGFLRKIYSDGDMQMYLQKKRLAEDDEIKRLTDTIVTRVHFRMFRYFELYRTNFDDKDRV